MQSIADRLAQNGDPVAPGLFDERCGGDPRGESRRSGQEIDPSPRLVRSGRSLAKAAVF